MFRESIVQALLWLAVLAPLVIMAWYVERKLRPGKAQQDPTGPSQQEQLANELLAKSRELHAQGGLSDEEFRTIKTKLAAQFQGELKENGETG